MMDRLIKVNKIKEEEALRVARLLGTIATVCTDDQKTETFVESVKPLKSEVSPVKYTKQK